MTTVDIVAFIRARLDDLEAHARKDLWCVDRATNAGQWEARYGVNLGFSLLTVDGQEIGRLSATGTTSDGDAMHAADVMLAARLAKSAHSRAARVLRQVEAMRRLLAGPLAAAAEARVDHWSAIVSPETRGLAKQGHQVLLGLAAIWFDHPEYQEGWET